MSIVRRIEVQQITPANYAPFGRVLGQQPTLEHRHSRSDSEQALSWHDHLFDPGPDGEVEFVWAHYKWNAFAIRRLESHRLTEQAIIPVTGKPIIHVVCPPPLDMQAPEIRPNLDEIAAFLLDGSRGVCMKKGCWHWPVPLVDMATYLVVTRRSTTVDLWRATQNNSAPVETVRHELSDLTSDRFEFVLSS